MSTPLTLQDLFLLGMKRELPDLYELPHNLPSHHLNIGAGKHHIPTTFALDISINGWDANKNRIPYGNESVGVIHCYHFLEHLEHPVDFLVECERVLASGGVMNICVPHWSTGLAHHDLQHRHTFGEKTFEYLFSAKYHNEFDREWRFRIHLSVLMGLTRDNLAMFTQLVKE